MLTDWRRLSKTRVFADIVASSKSPVWILVNRVELLYSAKKAINDLGRDVELLHPDVRDFDPSAGIVVAMVQTLRLRDIALDHVRLLIIDEAHLTDFDSQIPRFQNAYRIGFSATPKRKGTQAQLTNFYTKLIARTTISQLINGIDGIQYLVPCKEYHFTVANVKDLKLSKDDFNAKMMYSEFDKSVVYSGVVNNWLRICPGVRTLVFCVNIKHAQKMTAEFNSRGIKAKYIVSVAGNNEHTGDRDEVLSEWRSGEFDVLINASIFTTGFDEPSIRCVILARATDSENLYFQMVGRGSRLFEGKEFFYLLDFGENIQRHGRYSDDKKYSLVHPIRTKKGAPVMKECPQCMGYISGSCRTCPECGYVYPLSREEQIEIELQPFKSVDVSTIDVYDLAKLELVRRARKHTPTWLCVQLKLKAPDQANNLIARYAAGKNYKSGWAQKQIEIVDKILSK